MLTNIALRLWRREPALTMLFIPFTGAVIGLIYAVLRYEVSELAGLIFFAALSIEEIIFMRRERHNPSSR